MRHRSFRRCAAALALAGWLGACGGAEPVGPPGGPPVALDQSPPLITGSLLAFDGTETGAIGSHIFLPSDTIQFLLSATDAEHLEWIGFRLVFPDGESFSDSLPVEDSLMLLEHRVRVFLLPTDPPMAGLMPITAFARDSAGNLAETPLAHGPASLVASTETMYPQAGGGGTDFSMDLKGSGGSLRTYWVNTATSELGREDGDNTVVTLPAPPESVDITGNPAVVAVTLPTLDAIALVHLVPSAPTVTLIPDTTSAIDGIPRLIRVDAGNHAVVYRTGSDGSGYPMSYVDFDLATGEQTLIASGTIGGGLERSADRRRIVAWERCCSGMVQVYTSETRSFSLPVAAGSGDHHVALDAAGSLLMVGPRLYELPSMSLRALFHLSGASGPTTLSPDGKTLLAKTTEGLLRVRVSDGVGYDLFPLPDWAGTMLLATPEGTQALIPTPNGYGNYFRFYVTLPPLPSRPTAMVAANTPARAITGSAREGARIRWVAEDCTAVNSGCPPEPAHAMPH